MVYDNCSSPDDRRARCEKYRLSRFYRVHLISKEMDRMTNKKFKLAAMSLALTACVAASPLSAGAEAPEAAADVQPSAAADTATEDKPSPETVAAEEPAAEAAADPVEETPAQSTEEPPAQEPEAAPAGDAAVLPALPGARPVVVDMPAAEAPADAAGEPAEAAEDPKDAADSAEETAEDADAAEDAETPEPPEIAIARPDAAQPAVQPGIAAPAIQPGGISVMLPGETRQVALNTQASNEDGTVMGDFETVVKNAKAGQEIILQEDYTGSLTIFDWIRLNLNKKTVTGTITVDLSGKKADGSRGAVEIVNGTITGNRNDTSGYGGGGVCADSGDLTIDHCRITDNTAANGSGGGVSMGGKHGGTVENASLTIKDSVISGNTSTAQGGGVYAAVTTARSPSPAAPFRATPFWRIRPDRTAAAFIFPALNRARPPRIPPSAAIPSRKTAAKMAAASSWTTPAPPWKTTPSSKTPPRMQAAAFVQTPAALLSPARCGTTPSPTTRLSPAAASALVPAA